ncbi:MAG: hypothetical protein V4615_05520 [Bacteroidota bacterium]
MKPKLLILFIILIFGQSLAYSQDLTYLECDGKFFPVINGTPVYSIWVIKSSILAPKDSVVPEGKISWGACRTEMIDDALPELPERYYILYTSPLHVTDKLIRLTAGNFTDETVEITGSDGIKQNIATKLVRPNTLQLATGELTIGNYNCRITQQGRVIFESAFKIMK